MSSARFVAIDTCVLIDLALDDQDTIDAIETIRQRLKPSAFLVTPTVLQELSRAEFEEPQIAEAADRALRCMLSWDLQPVNLIPVGNGLVQEFAFRLRRAGIIPEEEVNDSEIAIEAALLGCQILLSADSHLRNANADPRFREMLKEFEVEGDELLIADPKSIVRKFFPQ